MLVELSIDQPTLRGEATLEVSQLAIDDLEQTGVIAADCLIGKLDDFTSLSPESVDCRPKIRRVYGFRGSVDDRSQIVVVQAELISVVWKIKGDQVIGGQMVGQD